MSPPGADRNPRLDLLLVARGLAPSRERAQALILAGRVEVEGRRAAKAGERVDSDSRIVVLGPDHPYVGRGGVKLAGALDRFVVPVADRVALDVGASTGGFTDCLLQRGARRVYAVDVGFGQLHERLRRDPRVAILDRRNARHLSPESLPERVTLATVDVSFISLRLILPPLIPLLERPADLILLVKPQFEVSRREVGKGGIVRDPALHRRVLTEILSAGREQGLYPLDVCPSPLPGAEGNREFFLHFTTVGSALPSEEMERRVREATGA
jgi:23S rRNA (cytidine1920-2'-O)/16S rRNA (cytidine1409-2'-O)-methyltransferase